MNIDYYNDDIIDAFLNGELALEQQADIQSKMAAEPDYAEQVELQSQLRKALKLKAIQTQMQAMTQELEQDGFYEQAPEDELDEQLGEAIKVQKIKEEVQGISTTLETEGFYDKNPETTQTTEAVASEQKGKLRPLFSNMRWLGVAASVLLVFGAIYLLMPKASDPNMLFASYFDPAQEDIGEDLDLLLKGTGFAIKKDELALLKEGVIAYKKKEFQGAIAIFEPWLEKESEVFDAAEIRYLTALCLLATEQTPQALKHLQLLEKNKDFAKQEELHWYLALGYIKMQRHDLAKKYLEKVKDSERYGPSASDLLRVKMIQEATHVIEGKDRGAKQLRFGLKDITKLSLAIDKKNGKITLLNESNAIPEHIQVASISLDVFDGEDYSGSFDLQAGEPIPVAELMPDETLVFNLVVLKDLQTNETASWERVSHQWVQEGTSTLEVEM